MKEKINCLLCNDTKIIYFKEIERVMFQWQPWKSKKCKCVKGTYAKT
jgi:hypothetical protein